MIALAVNSAIDCEAATYGWKPFELSAMAGMIAGDLSQSSGSQRVLLS